MLNATRERLDLLEEHAGVIMEYAMAVQDEIATIRAEESEHVLQYKARKSPVCNSRKIRLLMR